MSGTGYNPHATRANPDTMQAYLTKPISGDLTEIPRLGAACAEVLRRNGVTTTYALFGKFLTLKDEGVESVELCNRFFFWLESIEYPAQFRNSLVYAVAVRLDSMLPGLYDETQFE